MQVTNNTSRIIILSARRGEGAPLLKLFLMPGAVNDVDDKQFKYIDEKYIECLVANGSISINSLKRVEKKQKNKVTAEKHSDDDQVIEIAE